MFWKIYYFKGKQCFTFFYITVFLLFIIFISSGCTINKRSLHWHNMVDSRLSFIFSSPSWEFHRVFASRVSLTTKGYQHLKVVLGNSKWSKHISCFGEVKKGRLLLLNPTSFMSTVMFHKYLLFSHQSLAALIHVSMCPYAYIFAGPGTRLLAWHGCTLINCFWRDKQLETCKHYMG